jgi:hypothetical protein
LCGAPEVAYNTGEPTIQEIFFLWEFGQSAYKKCIKHGKHRMRECKIRVLLCKIGYLTCIAVITIWVSTLISPITCVLSCAISHVNSLFKLQATLIYI